MRKGSKYLMFSVVVWFFIVFFVIMKFPNGWVIFLLGSGHTLLVAITYAIITREEVDCRCFSKEIE